MRNHKGQFGNLALTLLIAGMLFMTGMLFIAPVEDTITQTRLDLNCSLSTAISDGSKLTCLAVDAVVPYIILSVLSVAGGLIISKFAI